MNKNQALKEIMSAFSGSLGSRHCNFSGNLCADAMTAQGSDLIQYVIAKINYYFTQKWHADTELHKHLGIATPNKISHNVVTYSINDSASINFDIVLASINESIDDVKSFFELMYEFRIKMYFGIILDRYCEKYGVENRFELQYEGYYKNALFFSTNNYIMWDGKDIICKGAAIVGPSSADYPREILMKVAKMLLADEMYDIGKIRQFLLQQYTLYCQRDINEICPLKNVSKIDSGDGAAWHNELTAKLTRYMPIQVGDVVCQYKTDCGRVFCFIPMQYPIEVAPKFAYRNMFASDVIDRVNLMLEGFGMNKFDNNLKIVK